MKTLPAGVIQGSDAWKAARRGAFTASELPSAAGESKYMPRAELLKQKHSGIEREVDSNTQALFNKGHAAEAAARVFAEEIIGEPLSPVTGYIEVDGMKLLSSFDGITFDGEIIWEHKLISAKLCEQIAARDLEPHYRLQLDQQLLVSGAERCLFMASDGTAKNMLWMWYEQEISDDGIIAIWKQFANDLGNYQPVEHVEKPAAEVIMSLPALAVQATGMVTHSNLPQFKAAAESYIANISTDLQTDEDFVNAEATVKFCKQTEETLEVTKKAILAQTATIDEVIRTVDYIQAQLRDKRLMLDKLVKTEKESIRRQIGMAAASAFETHRLALEAEIAPLKLLATPPDINEAMKNKRTLSSMHNAVDTALAEAKIAADAIAKDIRAKLTWCKDSSAGFGFLFSDLSGLIANNGMEAFQAIVNGRIAKHKADEAAKEEATRLRIQAEEEAKAKAAQDALLAAERAKMEADVRAKAEQDAARIAVVKELERTDALDRAVEKEQAEATAIEERRKQAQIESQIRPVKVPRPSDKEIIGAIRNVFGCTHGQACDYILVVAENLRMAA